MKKLDSNAEKEIAKDKKIFNRFKKRIYDFLLLDKKFLFDKNNTDLNPLLSFYKLEEAITATIFFRIYM